MKKEDVFFEAMKARDPRFDGKFFVGVKTTGIYCRPICPAKPLRKNVEFFESQHAAEKAGYRACLRCRPESAPMSPAWIGKSAVVQRAAKRLQNQNGFGFSEEDFAAQFGLSARHLRRLFMTEIGKTPKQLALENRLDLARKLIAETGLTMTEVAYASGFSSIRRFNESFRLRFKLAPSRMRRSQKIDPKWISLSIPYRPPFDFDGLLASYQRHRVGNLERFENGEMYRIFVIDAKIGHIRIQNDASKSRLLLHIDYPDTSKLHVIVNRVRNLFDLDSDPVLIANSLEIDPELKKLLKSHPGIRLPSGWDPFEIAIATILGQLVSVERGRSLVEDLIEIAGSESEFSAHGKKIKLFPTPEQIVSTNLSALKTTGRRRQTLIDFSQALLDGRISLESTQDIESFSEKLLAIPGIGRWTVDYMAMKVLKHTDSFPATDLILARAIESHKRSENFEKMRPWRAYAAALLWRGYVPKKGKRTHEKSTN